MLGSSLSLTAIVVPPVAIPPGTSALAWRTAGAVNVQMLWTASNGQSTPMIWGMKT